MEIGSERIVSAREFLKNDNWFCDTEGRYILFRGVNFGSRSKLAPYLPVAPLNRRTITMDELKNELNEVIPHLKQIRNLGFNIVRLLVMWKAIESIPNPNLDVLLPEGEQYLNLVKVIVDQLYAIGLFVIIDFHQDLSHEVYDGDGFPDWALAIDEFHPRPLPSNLKNKRWALSYYSNHFVRHTLRSFWKNNLRNTEFFLKDYPVRSHLEKTIGLTVKFFKSLNNGQGHPAILGIEPFNEPHPVGIEKKIFEQQYLKEFYINVLNEINRYDNKLFVFIEPSVDWNLFSPIDTSMPSLDLSRYNPFEINLETKLGIKREPSSINTLLSQDLDFINRFKSQGIFSFHYYDPWTLLYSFFNLPDNMHNKKSEWPNIFKRMCDVANSTSLVPFLTEFGGSQDWEEYETDLQPSSVYEGKQIRAYMNLQYIQVESFLLNCTYWNYDLYNTFEDKDNWNLENFSLLGPNRVKRHIDIVARPYPIRSSAKPSLLFFDLETKVCAIILKGVVVDSPTIIYIPYQIHYPHTFKVLSTSDKIECDKENNLLYWYPDKKQTFNQIIVTPLVSLNNSILPKDVQSLLEKTIFTSIFEI